MQAFVPKNRRPKFNLRIRIIDLNNVPLVSGTSLVKWHLPSSTAAEHRGRTSKSIIRDHKVVWDYEKQLPIRLVIDKHGMLQESEIFFEVVQEYSAGAGRGEVVVLGNVRLNLAEFVVERGDGGVGEDGGGGGGQGEGVTRRYLMQQSKINSTLKIGIFMHQTEGDTNFIAPPLKIAPVFEGIAGIVASDQGEPDNIGHMSSMSSKTRETSKLQDMYRQTLTASWAAQTGELPADKCIEDLFAGGDGWGGKGTNDVSEVKQRGSNRPDGSESDGDQKTLRQHQRKSSRYLFTSPKPPHHRRNDSGDGIQGGAQNGVSGRASIDQQVRNYQGSGPDYGNMRAHEVDELSACEDLRSWHISQRN